MRNLIVATVAVFALSGCNSMGIILGPKVEPSTDTAEKTVAYPFEQKAPAIFGTGYDQSLCGKLTTSSSTPPPGASSIPVVAAAALNAIGGVVIDTTVQAANDKVKEIEGRASKSWTGDWITTVDAMRKTDCIALIRYTAKISANGRVPSITQDDVQMAILLRVMPFGSNAFQLSPIYALSRKSLALTKCESNCSGNAQGHVSISIALTQTFQKPTGEITEGGNTTLSIGSVPVSEKGTLYQVPINNWSIGNALTSSPSATKPVSYVGRGPENVYVKFAVTENGTLSGQDHAQAEMKALGEALGPLAKSVLDKKLKDLSAAEDKK
ncbi:hypothetical protein [Raoultella ornithinolytica]|uniref:hypothetical protein n=1 Tax=Raoultella ornithinolytica TaxID=54291 RepID=UPI00064F6AEC|nr:hypothetical protein [Raoultella ornithinolytica]EJD6310097.1 hypothetical protein [Raoultella ornithinolytica]EKW1874963.1 hypothetical protein [Raoultella ornithinolytica]PJR11204.1 hypothetical protein CDD79_06550 [Raoultella ornithinolytica]QLK21938.1 hypothetical protein GPJ66_14605 [Raoultella ornithinolytica]WKL81787.1 hypothetical protein Q1L34_14820 [Raoultella ornithinolytica]